MESDSRMGRSGCCFASASGGASTIPWARQLPKCQTTAATSTKQVTKRYRYVPQKCYLDRALNPAATTDLPPATADYSWPASVPCLVGVCGRLACAACVGAESGPVPSPVFLSKARKLTPTWRCSFPSTESIIQQGQPARTCQSLMP